MQRAEREPTDRGFTLVEVLVAGLIFAIGVMAAIAMQYSALGGYANSRDVSRATDVGERVIHLLKAESQQWTSGTGTTDLPNTMVYTAYEDGSSTPFKTFTSGGYLENISWDWTAFFESPVDVRLSDAGARLYCAYYRGEHITPSRSSGGTTAQAETGIYRVQVAVVYPAPNTSFPGATQTSAGSCTSTSITDDLAPQKWDATSAPPLETDGYRAVYMGTQVIFRNFVTEAGSVSAPSS